MTNVEQLDALTNRWLLAAADPYPAWALKVRVKKVLQHSAHPEVLAGRILQILTVQQVRKAA